MLWLIKRVFSALSSFSGPSVTKYLSLSNERCMARPTLIELNPSDFNYYPVMTSLDKCSE